MSFACDVPWLVSGLLLAQTCPRTLSCCYLHAQPLFVCATLCHNAPQSSESPLAVATAAGAAAMPGLIKLAVAMERNKQVRCKAGARAVLALCRSAINSW
jgi:hypothetical protein